LGFNIFATEHTAEALKNAGLHRVTVLHKIRDRKEPNVLTHLLERRIDLVLNIPSRKETWEGDGGSRRDEYLIRRLAVEFNIPIVTTLELSKAIVEALAKRPKGVEEPRSLNEYEASLIQAVPVQKVFDS